MDAFKATGIYFLGFLSICIGMSIYQNYNYTILHGLLGTSLTFLGVEAWSGLLLIWFGEKLVPVAHKLKVRFRQHD